MAVGSNVVQITSSIRMICFHSLISGLNCAIQIIYGSSPFKSSLPDSKVVQIASLSKSPSKPVSKKDCSIGQLDRDDPFIALSVALIV
jgi:hypothetical protein